VGFFGQKIWDFFFFFWVVEIRLILLFLGGNFGQICNINVKKKKPLVIIIWPRCWQFFHVYGWMGEREVIKVLGW
jgi:hypothetical protein